MPAIRQHNGGLLPVLPIPRPAAGVCNRKDHHLRNHLLINQTERELMESIFPEIAEVERPSLRGLLNRPASFRHRILKLLGCCRTPVSIPGECRQIFLLRLGMESQWLICHSGLLLDLYLPSLCVESDSSSNDRPFLSAASHETVFTAPD